VTAIGRLAWTAIDCPDARALAAFYAAITGWPVDEASSDGTWIQLTGDHGGTLAFQQVAGYRPPEWPSQEHPQQEHPDFYVDDLDAAEAQVLAIGAAKHPVQPSPENWRVYLDPAGHPFCLITS
jgi:predicted enzyme related to lactoylglutathione lyase